MVAGRPVGRFGVASRGYPAGVLFRVISERRNIAHSETNAAAQPCWSYPRLPVRRLGAAN